MDSLSRSLSQSLDTSSAQANHHMAKTFGHHLARPLGLEGALEQPRTTQQVCFG